VVRGLNNPRQLSLSDGTLYVAEAGKGGPLCEGEGEDAQCIGATGSIAAVSNPAWTTGGTAKRVVSGLVSAAGADGTFAVGADGVSVRHHKASIQMTFAPPDVVPKPLPSEQLGKLLTANLHQKPVKTRIEADISAVEFETPNPDGYVDPATGKPELDSNPYAVLDLGDKKLVADAAGNDIIEVRKGHKPRVWAVLPFHGDEGDRQPTPTSLAVGPFGTILVGELAHEEAGEARVDVYTQSGRLLGYIGDGGTWGNVPGGFTTITGVTYANGSVYVSQLFAGDPDAPGLVTKVALFSGRTSTQAVPFPAGIAADRSGNVYVSAWSIATDQGAFGAPDSSGQIWRLRF